MKNEEAATTTEVAAIAEQGANVAPERAGSKRGASPKKDAPTGPKTARGDKAKAKASKKKTQIPKEATKRGRTKETPRPRAESKGAKILELIGQTKGASLTEIMKATDWQAHSVRGFLSTTGKKHGLNIESTKNEAGERIYKMVK